MKNEHPQTEELIPQHPKLILSLNGRQATSSETFPDKLTYLLPPLNINYNKDILIHLYLLIINYILDILEDTISVRDSPCFQEWQTTKIFSLLPGHMIAQLYYSSQPSLISAVAKRLSSYQKKMSRRNQCHSWA